MPSVSERKAGGNMNREELMVIALLFVVVITGVLVANWVTHRGFGAAQDE